MQKGDTVTVSAPGYYPHPVPNSSFAFSLASFVAGLLQPPPGAPRGDGRRRGLPLLSIGISAALPGLVPVGGGVPKGYVRLLVFDADSTLVGSQTQQLSPAARAGYESLQVQVIAPQDGYVTAYVGNESNADVYFDDVTIEHRQGLQVQENQYDPTGLELAGLSRDTPGLKPLNQYRWNGKEFQADLGLNWNHQDWRFFDTQLARWHVVDPEIENGQESWTPYSFGFDNAVRYADADGRYPGGLGDALLNFANGVAVAVADNASMGAINNRASMGRGADDPSSFNAGQRFGDRLSVALGCAETFAAGVGLLGLGAGEIGSAGLATPVVAVAAPAMGAAGAHGVGMAQRALGNIKDENGRVNASSRTSGENSAAAKGRQAHKEYNPGSTHETDPSKNRLENGKIPDGVDRKNRVVSELKPNNARAIKRGEKQVEGYRQQLEKETGKKWTSRVDTYNPK